MVLSRPFRTFGYSRIACRTVSRLQFQMVASSSMLKCRSKVVSVLPFPLPGPKNGGTLGMLIPRLTIETRYVFEKGVSVSFKA
jgi:hypothetical protein